MEQRKKIKLLLVLVLLVSGLLIADDHSPIINISINPNPVLTNTLIELTFDKTMTVNIVIENVDGSIIKTFFTGEITDRYYKFFWDRISDAGSYVPEGKYYLSVYYDYRFTSTKKTIILK